MNRPALHLMLFAAGLAAAAVTSEDTAAHKARMDDAQDLKADLKDALDAKAAAKAAEPAQKLVKLCLDEEGYWVKTKLPDAVKLARQNVAEAGQIASAATQGHLAEALAGFDKLEATCRTCHDLHPEKRLTQTSQPKE